MRILFIVPEYPPYNIGGGGIAIQEITQTLSRNGYDVYVIAGYYPTRSLFEKVSKSIEGKVKIFWLPLIPSPRSSFQLKTVMPPNLFSVSILMKIILKWDFNIIHLHGFGHMLVDIAALLCRVAGKRYIFTLHGFPRSPLNSIGVIRILYTLYFFTIGKSTLSLASKITTVSSAVKEEAVSYTHLRAPRD